MAREPGEQRNLVELTIGNGRWDEGETLSHRHQPMQSKHHRHRISATTQEATGGQWSENANKRPAKRACSIEIRRRPTLPGGLPPSTIGAGSLNFRVRDGNGCDPAAIATEIFGFQKTCPKRDKRLLSTPEQARAIVNQALGRLVPVG